MSYTYYLVTGTCSSTSSERRTSVTIKNDTFPIHDITVSISANGYSGYLDIYDASGTRLNPYHEIYVSSSTTWVTFSLYNYDAFDDINWHYSSKKFYVQELTNSSDHIEIIRVSAGLELPELTFTGPDEFNNDDYIAVVRHKQQTLTYSLQGIGGNCTTVSIKAKRRGDSDYIKSVTTTQAGKKYFYFNDVKHQTELGPWYGSNTRVATYDIIVSDETHKDGGSYVRQVTKEFVAEIQDPLTFLEKPTSVPVGGNATFKIQNVYNYPTTVELTYNGSSLSGGKEEKQDTHTTDGVGKLTYTFDCLESWPISSFPATINVKVYNDVQSTTTSFTLTNVFTATLEAGQNVVSTGTGVNINLVGGLGDVSYVAKFGSTLVDEGSTSSSSVTITPSYLWFPVTTPPTNLLDSVYVTFTNPKGKTATVHFKVQAGADMFASISSTPTHTNVKDSRMPNSMANDIIVGYSKVLFKIGLAPPSIPGSTIKSAWVHYGASTQYDSNTDSMQLTYNSQSGKYEATTPTVIKNKKTYFIVKITDSNGRVLKVNSSYPAYSLTATELTQMTLSFYGPNISNSRVAAGKSFETIVSDYVGTYSYQVTVDSVSKQSASGRGSGSTTGRFDVFTSASWFPSYNKTSSQKCVVTVTDKIGRSASKDFWIDLPQFTVTLDRVSYYLGQTINITLGGTGGQTITGSLKAVDEISKQEVELDSWSSASTSVSFSCIRNWFVDTHNTTKSSLQLTITAARGNSVVTKVVSIYFPDLTLEIDKDPAQVTVGEECTFTITNRYNETLTLAYIYSSRTIKSWTVYSPIGNSAVVTYDNPYTLFNDANEITAKALSLTVKVSDVRGRSKSITLSVLADPSVMSPSISSITDTLVQNAAAISAFPNTYIANVSKTKLTVSFSTPTDSPIDNALMTYGGRSVKMSLVDGDYEGTTTESITGNTTFTVKLTDKRGYSATQTYTVNSVYAYTAPKVNIVQFFRCKMVEGRAPIESDIHYADGTHGDHYYYKDDVGEYCYLEVKYTYKIFTSSDGTNAHNARVVFASSISGDTTTDNRTNVTSNSTQAYLFDANIERSYTITATAIDSIFQIAKETKLSTGYVIMDYLAGGKGIGLGKISETRNAVDINPEWQLIARIMYHNQLMTIQQAIESAGGLAWEVVTQ